MLAVLQIVLPVFLVVGLGYAAAAFKLFPDTAIDGLLLFVIRFATPCLLFTAMYGVALDRAFDVRLLFSYYGPAVACFVAALLFARGVGRRPGEAVAIAFVALFSNTLLIGLPIILRAYGDEVAEPAFGVMALQSPVFFSLGIIAMEVSRRDGAGALAAAKRAAKSIAGNALMIGVVLGLLFNLLEIRLPEPIEDATTLLSGATLPAALFVLGAALTRYRLQSDLGWAIGLATTSLFVHPGLAWLLSAKVFALDEAFVRAAVVLAAMPPGFNVYVFAAMYKRGESVAAGSVILATAFSVVSVTIWLTILGGAG